MGNGRTDTERDETADPRKPGKPSDNSEQRANRYAYLCDLVISRRWDPARADRTFAEEYGYLPAEEIRTDSFRTYRARYEGTTLRKRIDDETNGNLLVGLVKRGHSEIVGDPDTYERCRVLCRKGFLRWRGEDGGVRFFPSQLSLSEMYRALDDDGSVDGQGPPPPWESLGGVGFRAAKLRRSTWLVAALVGVWCMAVVWMLVRPKEGVPAASSAEIAAAAGAGVPSNDAGEPATGTPEGSETMMLGLLLVGVTVAGGILLYGHLRPRTRTFVAERFFSMANVTVLLSGLVVPIAANIFIRDYRHTQIQADLAKVLMEHLGKTGDEGELRPSQIALMINLLEANEGAFGLQLTDFKLRLVEMQKEQDMSVERELTQQLESVTAAEAAAKDEIDRIQKEKLKLERGASDLADQIATAEAKIKEGGKQAEDAREELRKLRVRDGRRRKKIQQHEDSLSELKTEAATLRSRVANTEAALSDEKARSEKAEKAEKTARKAAEEAAKSNKAFKSSLDETAKELAKAKSRNDELAKQLQAERTNRGLLEQEVRRTLLYYSRRAEEYSSPDATSPSPERLVRLTASKALQALDALEASGVALTPEEQTLQSELRSLDKEARKAIAERNSSRIAARRAETEDAGSTDEVEVTTETPAE